MHEGYDSKDPRVINKHKHAQLTPSIIPRSPNFDVHDSTYFWKWSQLPSPEEVRLQSKAQHLGRPPPMLFKDRTLFVKWGGSVRVQEAQCLYAIRRFLQDQVPVPEVYGWRIDGDERFIYMEYIEGQTLEQMWDLMEPSDQSLVCRELRAAFENLRRLEQDPSDTFIGNIVRETLYDRVFHIEYMPEAGPFVTVRDFHNWFTFLHRRQMPEPYSVPVEPFRYDLPDNSTVRFTHGDIHRSNVIVASSRPYHILAIVDWEQSGWLPAYWEARKAHFTANRSDEWSIRHLPMILEQYTSTWDPWDYYIMAMGC